jgi:CDP-glucose 4,6-dehydratase
MATSSRPRGRSTPPVPGCCISGPPATLPIIQANPAARGVHAEAIHIVSGNSIAPAPPAFWCDRPVLVTGATGLLGGWLLKRLVAARADVVALVRDAVPRSHLVSSGILDRVRVARGDVRDQETLERVLGEYEIVTVLHVAAQAIVGVANRNPISTLDTNIRGTWCVLEACRRSPLVKQIVIASSDKAYGDQTILPYKEDTPVAGRNPYDVSKSCADLVAQMYARTYGLPVAVTRCGNFYGGGDLNWNRIVPGTIRSVIRGERPLIRSDGTMTRDYIYVEDGAYAYTLLAEQLAAQPGVAGGVFNFSYERPLSVLQMVDSILEVMGSDLRPDVRNEAVNEIRDQYLDASKARQVLGWSGGIDLKTSLRATVDWYQEYLSRP